MRNASASVSRPARWPVLLIVVLALPVFLTGCGGGTGTDLVAQPQEMVLIDDCSQATVYVDRIVEGLWNQLCPANPAPMPGLTMDPETGEYSIRATVRGHDLRVEGVLSMGGPFAHGLQVGDVATTAFIIVADGMTGEGQFTIAPDVNHSLRVTGAIVFENARCEIVMDGIEFRGYAAGTTARLWGDVPFDAREFASGDRFEGRVTFEPMPLEEEMPPPRMDARRHHGMGPNMERTTYEFHLDPELFHIFG